MYNLNLIDPALLMADDDYVDAADALQRLVREFQRASSKAKAGEFSVPSTMSLADVLEAVADDAIRYENIPGRSCHTLIAQLDDAVLVLEANVFTGLVAWKHARDFEHATRDALQIRFFEQYLLAERDIMAIAVDDRQVIPQLLEMLEVTRQNLVSMAN